LREDTLINTDFKKRAFAFLRFLASANFCDYPHIHLRCFYLSRDVLSQRSKSEQHSLSWNKHGGVIPNRKGLMGRKDKKQPKRVESKKAADK